MQWNDLIKITVMVPSDSTSLRRIVVTRISLLALQCGQNSMGFSNSSFWNRFFCCRDSHDRATYGHHHSAISLYCREYGASTRFCCPVLITVGTELWARVNRCSSPRRSLILKRRFVI